ncbi:MAG: hypothetical protein K0S37_4089 [Microbacterium sp.]|nr:hypothetical protein [Microbacterium sp.]
MSKLLSAKETVLVMPCFVLNGIPQIIPAAGGAAVPISAPTKAVLDSWIPRTTFTTPANPVAGGNISGAIRDDLRLGLTGSERSSSRTITSVGRGEALTFYNFQAVMNFFRDESRTDNSTFNLARHLTRAQGVPFVIGHRVGATQTSLATVGEDWSFYFGLTGQPVPGYGDGEEQTIGSTFVPKNIVNVAHALTA